MRAGWLIPVFLGLALSCSERLDPADVEDADPADVVVSGAGIGLIGVGAAIAIPNFIAMQYRSKRSECQPNLKAIKTSELVYDANFDRFIEESSFWPDSRPGKHLRDFPSGSAFDTLGWRPDGQVRGSYKVVSTSWNDFLVTCIMDVDGDGVYSSWTATKTINVTMNTRNDVY